MYSILKLPYNCWGGFFCFSLSPRGDDKFLEFDTTNVFVQSTSFYLVQLSRQLKCFYSRFVSRVVTAIITTDINLIFFCLSYSFNKFSKVFSQNWFNLHAMNFIELELKGVGYKLEKPSFGYVPSWRRRSWLIRLGYSHKIRIRLGMHRFISLHEVQNSKATRMILMSIELDYLMLWANFIRSLREISPYKVKGIKFKKQKLKIKPGKVKRI